MNYIIIKFKVGNFNYSILKDTSPMNFSLCKSGFPLVLLCGMPTTISGTEQIEFESYQPISDFELPEDRKAIKDAICFLNKQYQS